MRTVADEWRSLGHTPTGDERLLAALRAEFPDWGIVHDAFADVWVALRGKEQTMVAADPAELRSRLTHAAGGRPPH